MLPLLHHYSSGMKAVYSQENVDHLFVIRQSIGGAGYSAWSGIPRIIEGTTATVTFDGDNTVMLQQSFNFLTKELKHVMEGQKSQFSYLNEINETLKKKCKVKNFLDLDFIEEALKVQVSYGLKIVFEKMKNSTASQKDQVNSLFALDIVKVAEDHFRFITFVEFKKAIATFKCKNNQKNIANLCMLNGLTTLYKRKENCYESGYFQPGLNYNDKILQAIKDVNLMLRPHILNILESIGIYEGRLQSAVGNWYGDIYEQHLEWAKNSRLNHTKGGDAIPDGFMEYMMPILKAKM